MNNISKSILLCTFFLGANTLALAGGDVPTDTQLRVGFKSDSGVLDSTINSAKTQILVALYPLTSRVTAKALVDAHLRGVKVSVVADQLESRGKYSIASYLADRGVAVRLVQNRDRFNLNFMIADGVNVDQGSSTYSDGADYKSTGMMWVVSYATPAEDGYVKTWESLWSQSNTLAKKY
jgi:phosphatidylserine/phosphatidylglycerophosphate/cardiolipin synthase-like enzyme